MVIPQLDSDLTAALKNECWTIQCSSKSLLAVHLTGLDFHIIPGVFPGLPKPKLTPKPYPEKCFKI